MGKQLSKGDRVRIVGGSKDKGASGTVFWVGPSKFGDGLRVGVNTDAGKKIWTSDADVQPETEGPTPESDAPEPRFCGFSCSDWHDEAPFVIAFRQLPDEAALRTIATTLLASSVTFAWGSDRHWSGRLLLLEASHRHRGAVRRWIRELHPRIAVEDVTFEGFRDGELETTELASQPRSQRFALPLRPVDDGLPEWAPLEAFDRIVQELHAKSVHGQQEQDIEQALPKQKKSSPIRFERIEPRRPLTCKDPCFAPFEQPEHEEEAYEDEHTGRRTRASLGDHPVLSAEPPLRAKVATGPGHHGAFAYLDEGGARHQVASPGGLDIHSVRIHPSEPRALVGAAGMVLEVDHDEGRHRLLGTGSNAAFLANGHIVLGGPQIVLLAPDGTPVDRPKGQGWVTPFADGKGVIAVDPTMIAVYALAPGSVLKELALWKVRLRGHVEVVGHEAGAPQLVIDAVTLAATGAVAAVEAAAKKKSRRKSQPLDEVLRFERIEPPDAPAEPTFDLPAMAVDATAHAWSPSGRYLAFRLANDPWLRVLDTEDGSLAEEADYEPDRFWLRDDGTLVACSWMSTRWRWAGPSRPGFAWPGVEKRFQRPTAFGYVRGHDLVWNYVEGHGLYVVAREGDNVVQRWWTRAFRDAGETEDGRLFVRGPLGSYAVTGLSRVT